MSTSKSASGTRLYGTTVRLAVGAASAASAVLGVDEVCLHASVKCYVKNGADPTAVANGDSIPLEAGEKFHMQLAFADKIAVIRDTADGFLHISPVQ